MGFEMNVRYMWRVVSILTVVCLLHVYVLAVPAANGATGARLATGTIKTANNQPVIVNGNLVKPGTTILSGSTIETPADVDATLLLASGNIYITPGTEFTVEFTADRNETKVARGAVFPEPLPGDPVPQQLIARLVTQNNQPITVNGAATGSGSTIVTGATIETPDQVSATIDLGAGGVVEVGPNSVIKLDFDQNGNVRVKVVRGCAVTKKKQNVLPGEMEVYTDTDSIKTNKDRKQAGGCILPTGQLSPTTGIGAAAGTGAISGTLAAVLIAGGGIGALIIVLGTRGGNPSPSSP
jgi:hypothetical protein